MRGGDRIPVLIRKTEPQPIRVFLQDGEQDQCEGIPEVGDWWNSNLAVQRSLAFAGYEHQFVWGKGAHTTEHAEAVFPDAMRFLWKDWPAPVEARRAASQNLILRETLDSNASWEVVAEVGEPCTNLVGDAQGNIYFTNTAENKIHCLDIQGSLIDAPKIPAGKPYTFTSDATPVFMANVDATCILVENRAHVYVAEADGNLWLVKNDDTKKLVASGLGEVSALALTPDGLWLAAVGKQSRTGWSWRVREDGSLDSQQRYYWIHVPEWLDTPNMGNMLMDCEGHAYLATHIGVQIFDRNGRSRGILPLPKAPTGIVESIAFGGVGLQTLYAIADGKLYCRPLKVQGFHPAKEPVALLTFHAG